MPSGRPRSGYVGSGEFEHPGSSIDEIRQHFLLQVRQDARHVLTSLESVCDAELTIAAWGDRWRLCAPWLVEVAERTVLEWKTNSIRRRHHEWAQLIVEGEIVPEPEAIRWLPTLETEHGFRARVDAYVASIKKTLDSQGLVTPSNRPNLARDMAALVRLHFTETPSLRAVAREFFGADYREDAARKAITKLAAELDLPIRKQN